MTRPTDEEIRAALVKADRETPPMVRGFWLVRIPARIGREIFRRDRDVNR